jgi:hypothetical protein
MPRRSRLSGLSARESALADWRVLAHAASLVGIRQCPCGERTIARRSHALGGDGQRWLCGTRLLADAQVGVSCGRDHYRGKRGRSARATIYTGHRRAVGRKSPVCDPSASPAPLLRLRPPAPHDPGGCDRARVLSRGLGSSRVFTRVTIVVRELRPVPVRGHRPSRRDLGGSDRGHGRLRHPHKGPAVGSAHFPGGAGGRVRGRLFGRTGLHALPVSPCYSAAAGNRG